MTTVKTKKLRGALLRKGFDEVNSHHHMFFFMVGGKKTSVRTRLSHSGTEYGDNLLSQVAKQMRLKKAELLDFIECTFTHEKYLEHLLSNEHVVLDTNRDA